MKAKDKKPQKRGTDPKKKWEKPQIKEHNFQDGGSFAFDEILLGPNDPAVT